MLLYLLWTTPHTLGASSPSESASAGSRVASSVAERALGPGTDPTSRFSYVYTGRHDHGTLASDAQRRASPQWTGLADALSGMKRHVDEYLTAHMEKGAPGRDGK